MLTRLFDALALFAAAAVIAAHIFVVEMDERRLSWHPLGHLSIFVAFLCVLAVAYGAILLSVRKGRSWPAVIAIAVGVIELVLLFWIPAPY